MPCVDVLVREVVTFLALSVGKIGLDLVVNQKSFNKQMFGIASLAKKAGAALASAFAVKKIVDFGKECLNLGSDLQEVQNVVDVTFPAMSAQVDTFAQKAATNFGLSETMAKQFSGTFGSMAKAFGFTEKQAYTMGTTLTGLAGDVASFYNITQDEAYTKLKSVFTGETESLKDLGVVMTQTALDSYALTNGFGKTTSAMSEAEKVALRYQFVQDQLSAAQGDFLRTSDGWANQVRVLNLQIDSLKANIGQGLINLFTPILKVINELIGRLSVLAGAFKSFTEMITGNKAAEKSVSSLAEQAASGLGSAADSAETLASTTNAVGSAAKQAAKEMKALMGFDEINKLTDKEEADDTTSTDASNLLIPTPEIDYDSLADDTGTSFLDKLKEKLAGIDFSRLTESLKEFREELSEFGGHLGEGLFWLYENVLKPVGEWAITEAVPRFFETLAAVLGVLNPIIEAAKPLLQWFWDEFLRPIAEWTGGMFLKIWDGINEALKKFGEWCEKNPKTIQTIVTIVSSLATAFVAVSTAVKIWNTVTGIATAVAGGLGTVIGFLTSPIGLVVLAIGALIAIGVLLYQNWDTIKAKAKEVWDSVKKKFDEVKESWNKCLDEAKRKFDEFKKNVTENWNNIEKKFNEFDTFLTGIFSKDWSKSFGGFGDVANGFLKNVSNIWDSIKRIFNGITTFIGGAFSGDWKKAWTGVKEILGGVWDGIVAVVKTPINLIIGAINGLISGVVGGINSVIGVLNGLSFNIPDWVPKYGGKTFGLNIPEMTAKKIPYLAEGGYVKRNAPQLAMIGDNRHQGEVVAPEDKMQQMADSAAIKAISALENYMAAMMAGFEAVVQAIKEQDNSFVIGDEIIGKAADRYKEKMAVITGGT